ncbi:hypothetical protein CGSSp9BS68_09606 [Streptococcus pneumoniae SP9-BS68]|uniref:Uncharacterized protein n=1 Tax=Streptococcus pneumoniae serotype 4 (strain ATCC BAA-334 / TIGR4) TaxID=170187 RepID=A0A0H2US51_STRPN|nr:hypothetical protein SP_1977 [Streptococcus pneumoniae TIGR4]EDK62746.1 hypothetical protein CGSSp11BS70_11396 [Streptococcus pneumoniae SP11-BS70]EDK67993.1 hypothetical protein CGSSp18BS74_06552 [Streptococcus pneumoniae SP18-BS74]EDK70426.1 hypothetical protein CGSSp19BS75_00696 [Streptococcus pneumoniae SP19-BS75]EDK79154.1 hypothetical protein CGSSp9BS68_09606 [Streptococcus pneumoniae SP9-BS68]EDK80953.1 hypothetical protein CGSSp23BS72_01015 [Streptococcus pneumoniae SP23-BS72]EFL66
MKEKQDFCLFFRKQSVFQFHFQSIIRLFFKIEAI